MNINKIVGSFIADESKEKISNIYLRGALYIEDRLKLVAGACASSLDGDLSEIGCYINRIFISLASVAKKHDRKIISIDPRIFDKQDRYVWNYEKSIDQMRLLGLTDTIESMESTFEADTARPLCFAFIGGLRRYSSCKSAIMNTAHCSGVIVVDNVRWNKEVKRAFDDCVEELDKRVFVSEDIRECYILPSII